MEQDIYIAYGGELKALGDGRVGGVGVQFTGTDLDREGFRADTYFGAQGGNGADCLFHHSVPIKGVASELSEYLFQPVKATRRDLDIFFETVLDMANEYEKYVHDLIEKGKLGWSTGAPGHMVRKSADGIITRWPISEVSFTPTPAEPRNRVMTLKSFLSEEEDDAPLPSIKINVSAITSVRSFEEFLRDAGFPKDAATTIASKGFSALRQRDSEEDAQATIQQQIARDRALLDLSFLTTGV